MPFITSPVKVTAIRRPIRLEHPWLKGDRRDIIDVLIRLKQKRLGGWLEDVGTAFLATISETAKKVVNALGLSSDEQKQVVTSTASVMKNYTQSLIDKVNWLANRYSTPGTYMRVGERGDHVKVLQEVINMLGVTKTPISENGVYDTATFEAVKDLQAIVGVKTDGLFGFYTAQALKNYLNSQVQSSSWWQKLLDIAYPVVAWLLTKPSEQPKVETYIKQGMATGQAPIVIQPTIPEQKEEKKGPLGLSWPVFIGLTILVLVALGGKGKEERA